MLKRLYFPQPGSDKGWIAFTQPSKVLVATKPEQVVPVLQAVDAALAEGNWVAGFMPYEAAAAFDPNMKVHAPDAQGSLPLAVFGVFDAPKPHRKIKADAFDVDPWSPLMDAELYASKIAAIKQLIASGDTYQVNFTYPMTSQVEGDSLGLFDRLCQAQPAPFSAFVECEGMTICSASPECFFTRNGSTVTCRPMKGTAERRPSKREDMASSRALRNSTKDLAENVMIVDMIRNDLGRLAQVGSVHVPELFTIEKYPTLYQMTSTVEARISQPLSEIFRNLFPCASITGAPKIRTMEIIHELESGPRGIYTGTIGWASPDGRASFNVAIRTVTIDAASKRAEYRVGSGIVWDSLAGKEFRECQTKTKILHHVSQPFSLLETMRMEATGKIPLLKRHLKRMSTSAAYFDRRFDLDTLQAKLNDLPRGAALRIRVLLDPRGRFHVESQILSEPMEGDSPFKPLEATPRGSVWTIPLDREPVDASNAFLYHKTTYRRVYDEARARFPEAPDVLLWNANREVTETSIGNIVVKLDGKWVTPPVRCGLLAGTQREELLDQGRLHEAVIHIDDLARAEAIRMINSVRKEVPVAVSGLPA